MKPKLILNIMFGLVMVVLSASCYSENYENGTTPLNNAAFIDAAEYSAVKNVIIKKNLQTFSHDFSIKLVSPEENDSQIGFDVNEGAVNQYNSEHSTNYTLLPRAHFSFSSRAVRIAAGKVLSDPVVIEFQGLDQLEIDKSYLLPISLTYTPEGIELLNGSETVWFVVKRSSAITTAADLSGSYMWVPSYETPEGWIALENFEGLTYETLVNINTFDLGVNVSTVMGVEQHCLMRVGDVNWPRQQVQINGIMGYWPGNKKDFVIPAMTLNSGEWYHLAFTWDIPNALCSIYVNGKLAYEAVCGWSDSNFDLNCLTTGGEGDEGRRFFIGYSYDPWRPLNGLVSEVRIWSKARSQEEIFRDMYQIDDPETRPELRAYWKFDEGSGNVVKDHSMYGNDAHCLDGDNDFELKQRKEGNLKWNTSVEIPVLNLQ